MKLTTPKSDDSGLFDLANIDLAVSTRYTTDGLLTGSMSVRVIPTKIGQDGQEVRLPEQAVPFTVGDIFSESQQDTALAEAVAAVTAAIEKFIVQKGI